MFLPQTEGSTFAPGSVGYNVMGNFRNQFLTENIPQPPGSEPSHSPLSSAISFSRLILTQDDISTPLQDISLEEHGRTNADIKKPKKITRLLLDARTELTDDELKVSDGKCDVIWMNNVSYPMRRPHGPSTSKLKTYCVGVLNRNKGGNIQIKP